MSNIRTVAQIQQTILNAVAADPILGSQLTSTSSTSLWRLWAYIIANSQAVEEQLANLYQGQIETIAASAAPATPQWVYKMALLFQYSATDPQLIQLNTTTLAPQYPVYNPAYQIVTRCSVTNTFLNNVLVKVAKGSTTPVPLASAELSAFTTYMNYIKPAGIIYTYVSTDSDKIYCSINAKVRGAYSSTISNALLVAYNNYLATLPFDGIFILSDLMIALKSVTGVVDIEFSNVNLRGNVATFPPGSYNMVNNYTQSLTSYIPVSGYLSDETTSGYDFISSLSITYV